MALAESNLSVVQITTSLNDMGAHLKWIEAQKVGQLRVGDRFKTYSDPYEFGFMVELCDGNAMLSLGSGSVSTEARLMALTELAKHSEIKTVSWERIRKDGTVHIAGPYDMKRWR
jgi:hypothetical protein